MNFRTALPADIPTLAAMRWDFRTEPLHVLPACPRDDFIAACTAFLQRALAGPLWVVWLAEEDGQIVSHIYIHIIEKVPNPHSLHPRFGYVTNVYTRPAYRNQGIGAQLMQRVKAWAEEQDLEMLVLWPSRRSVPFYQRAGFIRPNDMLTLNLRED